MSPNTKSKNNALALLAGMGCLLLLVALLYKLRQSDADDSHGTQKSNTSSNDSDPHSTRATMRKGSAHEHPEAKTHRYEQLQHFFIEELSLENTTFRQAIDKLRNEYERVCQRTGQQPIPMKFSFPKEPSHTFSITLTSLPFTNSLKTLTSIAGLKMERDGHDFTFTPLEKGTQLHTRLLVVPPDIYARLHYHEADIDPFADDDELAALPPRKTFHETFSILLNLPEVEGQFIKYIPATSTLVVRANETDLSRIQTLNEQFFKTSNHKFKISAKIISIPHDHKPSSLSVIQAAKLLNTEEAPVLIEQFSHDDKVEILTFPPVTLSPGDKGKAERIQHITIPLRHPPNHFTADWTGHRLTLTPNPIGFALNTTVLYTYRVSTPNTKDTQPTFKNHHSAYDLIMIGKPIAIYTFSFMDGKKSLLYISYEKVDPQKKPVPSALLSNPPRKPSQKEE